MRYALITGLLLIVVGLFAVPVSQDLAVVAARNWASEFAPSDFNYAAAEDVIPIADNSGTQLYLIKFPNGFVLTAGDNAVRPVLAYGFNTVTGLVDNNPAFCAYLTARQEEIKQILAQNPQSEAAADEWQALLNNTMQRNSAKSVSPLLVTTWNQGWPYNMYCPADPSGPGGHVYAGCVASAMAQVMKYWNWPPTGVGSHSYYASGYGNQSANFGATTYQWTQMPNAVHEANEAVALLMYHCGVSVDMGYSPDGSGAYSENVVTSWIQHFRYNTSIQLKSKNSYGSTQWNQMLRTELDAMRPLYYHGFGPNGGHAFVCDGYQNNDYFHFNWGWGGSYDGYFLTSNLNPGYTFNQGQGAIFNVFPLNYNLSSVQLSLQGSDCAVGDNTFVTIATYPLLPEFNVTSLSFVLEYDNTGMQYCGFNTVGTLLGGTNIDAVEMQPGQITFTVNSTNVISGGGNLLKINFRPMLPGGFPFDLTQVQINSTPVTLVNATVINVVALINALEDSVIDLLNAMYINYDTIAQIPLTTTFVLPSWNVNSASFDLHYQTNLVSWEGFDVTDCLASSANIEVTDNGNGVLHFNINFGGLLVGEGNLLKVKFRAIGNTGSVSLATLTITDFLYNQIPVLNLRPGYIVLMPVTANNDNAIVSTPGLTVSPNPFRDNTELTFTAPKTAFEAALMIYNLKGQLVRKLYQGDLKSGQITLNWDGKDEQGRQVQSGIYLLNTHAGNYNKTVRIIRVK